MTTEQIIKRASEKYESRIVRGEKGDFKVLAVRLIYLVGKPKIYVTLNEYRKATTPISVPLDTLEKDYRIVE